MIYIARDLPTAIAETIVRDRFEGNADRVLDETEFEDWAIAEVSALDPLTVLDLRTTGLLRLGSAPMLPVRKPTAMGRR